MVGGWFEVLRLLSQRNLSSRVSEASFAFHLPKLVLSQSLDAPLHFELSAMVALFQMISYSTAWHAT